MADPILSFKSQLICPFNSEYFPVRIIPLPLKLPALLFIKTPMIYYTLSCLFIHWLSSTNENITSVKGRTSTVCSLSPFWCPEWYLAQNMCSVNVKGKEVERRKEGGGEEGRESKGGLKEKGKKRRRKFGKEERQGRRMVERKEGLEKSLM